jgi:uncharacterized protein YbjQ (UPF0145 family)
MNLGRQVLQSAIRFVKKTTQGSGMSADSSQSIIISNTDSIPGRRIVEFYGVVTGNTVRAKHIGRDFMAGLKNIVGGELKGYTELLQDSRTEATERMIQQAQSMGANAVVNIRFATSSISQGAAELFAYGTAVKVE